MELEVGSALSPFFQGSTMEFVFLIYAILVSAQLKPLIIIAGEVMLGPEDIVTNPLILKL